MLEEFPVEPTDSPDVSFLEEEDTSLVDEASVHSSCGRGINCRYQDTPSTTTKSSQLHQIALLSMKNRSNLRRNRKCGCMRRSMSRRRSFST